MGRQIINGNLFLAPLAGYSDAAFRTICLDYGADFTYSEMISAEGLLYNREKSLSLAVRDSREKALALQIFTADPRAAAQAVAILLPLNPVLIDLNCGCPVSKVVKNGAGSALLKTPRLIGRLVAAMVKASKERGNSFVPITVKLRSGWDAYSLNYIETASEAVAAGASLVTLHPRTRQQGFRERANWQHVKDLKLTLPVPIIGSGDIFEPQTALSAMRQTGCDGLMLGRGAFGRPYLFDQIKQMIKGEEVKEASPGLRLAIARRHLRRAARIFGEKKGVKEMRKHFGHYTKGLPQSAALRYHLVRTTTCEQTQQVIADYLNSVVPRGQKEDETRYRQRSNAAS